MIQKLKFIIFGSALCVVGAITTGPITSAIDVLESQCSGANADTAVCKAKGDKADKLIQNVVNTLMFLLGAVSAIMIIVGGIKYVTSNGDSNSVQSAKNTILYAVIGLVVAIAASAIVNFVLGRL